MPVLPVECERGRGSRGPFPHVPVDFISHLSKNEMVELVANRDWLMERSLTMQEGFTGCVPVRSLRRSVGSPYEIRRAARASRVRRPCRLWGATPMALMFFVEKRHISAR